MTDAVFIGNPARHALAGRVGDRLVPGCPSCRQDQTAHLDDPTREYMSLPRGTRWCLSCSALSRVVIESIKNDDGQPIETWQVRPI